MAKKSIYQKFSGDNLSTCDLIYSSLLSIKLIFFHISALQSFKLFIRTVDLFQNTRLEFCFEKIMALISLDDYEKKAREVLELPAFDYYRSGAGNELSLSLNRSSFDKYDFFSEFQSASLDLKKLYILWAAG